MIVTLFMTETDQRGVRGVGGEGGEGRGRLQRGNSSAARRSWRRMLPTSRKPASTQMKKEVGVRQRGWARCNCSLHRANQCRHLNERTERRK